VELLEAEVAGLNPELRLLVLLQLVVVARLP
jgi:hypothetical protein